MFDYKTLTDEELADIFRDVPFKIQPMRHQLITFAHAIGENLTRTCLFHDIGTGKTLTALWLNMLWKTRKTLVICPKTAFEAWRRDIKGYTDFSYVILEGEKAERIFGLENDYNFYIINYEGLKTIYAKLQLTCEEVISEFNHPYEFLSNFHHSPIIWKGSTWPTLEHAFQAAKSNDPDVRREIRNAETPGIAKQMGRKIRLSFLSDWEEIKVEVMKELVKLKFLQYINLTKALLKTEGAKLVEGNYWHDNFWGDCNCSKCSNVKGENVLGNILMEARKELGGKGKPSRAWKIDFESFIDSFDGVVLDEVHKCTDNRSLQTKLCYQLSYRAKKVIGMTGTPIGSHLLDLWNLLKVVDLGTHLGLNFFKFREKYFEEIRFEWVPRRGSEEKILSRIAPITTSFKREECLDLPEDMHEVIKVDLTSEQRRAFDKIMDVLSSQVSSGEINSGNVLTKTQKLKEIAGGFLYSTDGKGKRTTKVFSKNPKLDAVAEIIEMVSCKIVIFHQFEEEGRILERWAKSKKIGFASMRGEIKDKDAEYKRFVNDDSVRLMIAHPRTASESLDMTVAWLEIFYSTAGFREREQAEGRIRRKHQSKKQLYIDIVANNSPDEVTMERIGKTKKLSERVLKFIRDYGKKPVSA